MTATLTVTRGNLYLAKETCDHHLGGLSAVVLQRRGDDLVILPVRHVPARGYVLKQRNVRGDRVVSAGDFSRSQGLHDAGERHAPFRWDADMAALVAPAIFRA